MTEPSSLDYTEISMAFEDKNLTCKDCGQKFIWSAGEQQFFAAKGFDRPPVRCLDCRKKKKERMQKGQERPIVAREQWYQIKCKKCGKTSEIPFQPRDPLNILCSQCFEESSKKE